jgi:flavin reductase (DIM6/NTAB) family NADH-FMN oxidoreductase RutF
MESGQFIACIPNEKQANMVRKTGSVSGEDKDKYESFNIDSISGSIVDAKVPADSVGFIECNLIGTFDSNGAGIVIGEAVKAYADPEGFDKRIRPETPQGRTLHHLGNCEFALLSPEVDI